MHAAPDQSPGVTPRRRPAEHGFTLVELLVAMSVVVALLAPTVLLINTAQNHAAGDISRSDTVQYATVGLRQMDQELRQAYEIQYPTSTNNSSPSCPEGTTGAAAGVQTCNVIDVLARLTSPGYSGSDFEVRYDCSVASTTISGDHACWRYLCSASASTSATAACTPTSTTLLSSRLAIDDLLNGTTSDPVFSLCYPAVSTTTTCTTGSPRPTSATVTIKLPSTGTQATNRGGDPSVIDLTDGLYFPDLDFGQ